MDNQELLDLIKDIQSFKSEFDHVELKAGHKGPPKVHDTLSSFSNKVDGGIILFGIDENEDYDIVGVYDIEDLQKQIMHQTKDMEPEVRAEFVPMKIGGKYVLAIIVPECSADLKPCYIKTKGMRKGSYIRVADSDELMNDYEIYNLVVSRGQAKEDRSLVLDSSLDDLDHEAIRKLIENVKITKPKLYRLIKDVSYEEKLKKLNLVDQQGQRFIPTLAGLLVFGLYPQQYFPSLGVTFLVLPHKEMGMLGSKGERFLDNKKVEGSIPEIIDEVETLIMRNMKQRTIIQGLSRLDIWEYPEDAIREAVRNAVIHRDYSELMQSNYIQVRMYPDRIEIESPGTLYGDVTINNLITSTKARNSVIITLLEDLKIIENRGSGIDTMIHTMKTAHLEPPQFKETRNSFIVTFKNHNFIDDEAISWLNAYTDLSMSDRQVAALVYIRNNERITNREYQELNSTDSVTATKELKYLLQNDLIIQNGTRGGAYYTLAANEQRNKSNSGPNSGPSEENSGPNNNNSVPSKQELINISEVAREKKRLDSIQMNELILRLCQIKSLTLQELSELLNRKPDPLRKNYLSKLVKEEKLELLYPDQINHPRQAYLTKKNYKK
ncbi:ATP-binding protein [Virgibacillus ainsalahensis]